jgi:glycosyltransferase involved in cell wall biosynthesis
MDHLPKRACSVSIITPFRNAADFLPGLLACVAAQKLDDYELLLVDDGSSDAGCKIASLAKRNNPRIRLFATGGSGVAFARNLAIRRAKAPLVAFLDVDDRWHPASLEAQLAFMDSHRDHVFSFANYAHVDAHGPCAVPAFAFWPLFRQLAPTGEGFATLPDAAGRILAENAVGTSTVVARRDVIIAAGGFDTSLPSASDWDLWLRLAAAGPVGYATAVRMDYLMHPGSISSDRARRLEAVGAIIERHGAMAERSLPGAIRLARGYLDAARGDEARASARLLPAIGHHFKAALRTRSRRAMRALANDIGTLVVSRAA